MKCLHGIFLQSAFNCGIQSVVHWMITTFGAFTQPLLAFYNSAFLDINLQNNECCVIQRALCSLPNDSACTLLYVNNRSAGSSLIQRVTLLDSCCGNVSFTVESPMLLLNGSVEVAGGYVYHSEGVSCDVNMMAVQANISIREGIPIGEVPLTCVACSEMNVSCTNLYSL